MLFPIEYIDHDIKKVHEIPHHFFTELQRGVITTFCEELFPLWMRGENYIGSRAIRDRFGRLYQLIQNDLSDNQRQNLYQAFFDSNRIEASCLDVAINPTLIQDLDCPNEVKINIKELFIWLYEGVLTKINSDKAPKTIKIIGKDIHNHYEEYGLQNSMVCPFCGLENVRLLKSVGRADYDHYFHKSAYPFSAVNMHNLVPMGGDCNKKKGATNVLFDDNGNRTIAFYPFLFNKEYNEDYVFELDCTEHPSIRNHNKGVWSVQIFPINVMDNVLRMQLNSWKRIFNIHNRYTEHIESNHIGWLKVILLNDDISNEIELRKRIILEELNNQLKQNEPNVVRLKSQPEILPRFLYFKFLRDDEAFATKLIDLFIKSLAL